MTSASLSEPGGIDFEVHGGPSLPADCPFTTRWLGASFGFDQPPLVFIVVDDATFRESTRAALQSAGLRTEDFASTEAFVAAYEPGRGQCLLADFHMPGIGGIELLNRLRGAGTRLISIMVSDSGGLATLVEAMRAGADDFIQRPIDESHLLAAVARALYRARREDAVIEDNAVAKAILVTLTLRQRQIMDLILAGCPNKNIAADLGISQRTVESHRASIMRKTGSKTLPALVRLGLGVQPQPRHAATSGV